MIQTIAIKSGPTISRHRSNSNVSTPWEFIGAVQERFGKILWDLAATPENAKAPYFITPSENSLKQEWDNCCNQLLWLNPPYSDIGPWANKCESEYKKGARILFLVPASVDSNWWKWHVHGKAWVEFISPRIKFEGHDDPFPKSLALACYNVCGVGYGCWRWKV